MKEYELYDNRLLLELLSQSDEQAFLTIYQRFWQKLFSIAYSRLHDLQEAEDIVHDVLSSLWANRFTNHIVSLDHYLAVASKYAVLSKIRSKQREKKYLASQTAPLVVEMPVESVIHYKKILQAVKMEVGKLPERCRLIFQYSRDEGKSVKEIAKILKISPKTVENQLTKAIKHLRVAVRTMLPFLQFLLLLF